jgi:hypothetical protein
LREVGAADALFRNHGSAIPTGLGIGPGGLGGRDDLPDLARAVGWLAAPPRSDLGEALLPGVAKPALPAAYGGLAEVKVVADLLAGGAVEAAEDDPSAQGDSVGSICRSLLSFKQGAVQARRRAYATRPLCPGECSQRR